MTDADRINAWLKTHSVQTYFKPIEPPRFSLRDHIAGLLDWKGLVLGSIGVAVGTVIGFALILFYAGVSWS